MLHSRLDMSGTMIGYKERLDSRLLEGFVANTLAPSVLVCSLNATDNKRLIVRTHKWFDGFLECLGGSGRSIALSSLAERLELGPGPRTRIRFTATT